MDAILIRCPKPSAETVGPNTCALACEIVGVATCTYVCADARIELCTAIASRLISRGTAPSMSRKQCAAVSTCSGVMSDPPQKASKGESGSTHATANENRSPTQHAQN